MIDEKIFKPITKELIQYYYQWYVVGGNLHIVLDDGNLDDEYIWYCQEQCLNKEDVLGYLIATLLRCFTLEERESMYNNKWRLDNGYTID